MKKSWIKKGIVGIIMLAIFLAPFSGGWKINKAKAQTVDYSDLFPGSSVKFHSASSSSAQFEVEIIGKQSDWEKMWFVNYTILFGALDVEKNSTVLVIMEGDNFVSSYDFSGLVRNNTLLTGFPGFYTAKGPIGIGGIGIQNFFPVQNLAPGKNYTATLYAKSLPPSSGTGNGIDLFGSTNKSYYKFGNTETFSIPPEGGLLTGDNPTENRKDTVAIAPFNLGCDILTGDGLIGCIAKIFYTVWEVSAIVVKFAGGILDFFVYYSTNSSSYTNEFVSQAWGAVRDIANIFFIITLLYIAIKTILGLNVTDNKRLVGAVIIVALIINFSLFTTKVVIDTSNILAKVFYNNITSKDASIKNADRSLKNATGASGQKSISVGLVDKFDPQTIIKDQKTYETSRGTFIFITILSIFISLYAAYIFLSVGIFFVARVVSLWIAMIFSPLAFVSYAVPFEIPGFGHKKWWDNLLKNAFLAPIFIFFLYIIVLFAGFLKTITDKTDSIMTVMVPFIILAVLLTQAKKIAVEYSGELGAALMKGAQMVGGLALGAATGGAALAGSKLIGGHYQKVANDDNLRAQASGDKEHFAKMGITDVNVQKKMQAAAQKKLARANYFAKSSFDIRQTGAGKGFSKVSGMDMSKGLGIKATDTDQLKGGRHAQQEREKEKGIERMKTYELTGAAAAKQNKDAEDWKEKFEGTKESAKEQASYRGEKFDEKEFRKDYEKGKDLEKYGLYGINGQKEIKNAERTNKDRRNAYANSLQDKADIDKARGAVKTFFAEWGKGMKKMITTPGGLAATAGLGIATGGVFVAPTIIGGGFLKALKETMKVRTTDSEVIAAIRKGENPNKDLIRELKKMTEKGHSDSGKLSDIAKKMTGEKEGEEHNKDH